MTKRRRLLAINNYFYRRGGAESVFLDHIDLFGAAGWDVVPFAMQHPANLPSPWSGYFVSEIEYGAAGGPLTKVSGKSGRPGTAGISRRVPGTPRLPVVGECSPTAG